MTGFLIPPGWHRTPPSEYVLEVVAIMMGFLLGNSVYTAAKAIRQTHRCWRRLGRKLTAYIIMIWITWSCGIIQTVVNYAYLKEVIEPSFWLFSGEVLVWSVQIQCLMQIMVNRVSLIMYSPTNALRLKIAVLITITIMNIGVMVIWVPAQLEVNKTFHTANQVWHRIEKSTFLIVDAALNFYFIYLVRSKLIQPGLIKYKAIYRFNLVMVAISISLDIAVIGVVTLPHPEIYVQFRTLTYMIKLHIEMTIAEFIAKLVKSSRADTNIQQPDFLSSSGVSAGHNTGHGWSQNISRHTTAIGPAADHGTFSYAESMRDHELEGQRLSQHGNYLNEDRGAPKS